MRNMYICSIFRNFYIKKNEEPRKKRVATVERGKKLNFLQFL